MAQPPTEHELKVSPPVSQQVKLLGALRSETIDDVIQTLKALLGIGDFLVTVENVKSLIDEYYDTPDLALYATHAVCRIRREGVVPRLVVKKLIGQDQGELRRTEEETELTESEVQDLVSTGFASTVKITLSDLREKRLALKLKLNNERRNYMMNRGEERYRLSLDSFVFTNPATGRTSDQQFEIEIEALNDAASAKLASIKHNMLKVLEGFSFSAGSKYERGIKLFYFDRPVWIQWLAMWSTGPGLNWVSVILTLLGLLLTILSLR